MVTCPRVKFFRVRQQIRRFSMENQTSKKIYFHYNHTDSCRHSRWTARQSYQYMYARPWQQVLDFYADVVNGRLSLSALLESETDVCDDGGGILEPSDKTETATGLNEDKTGRWARVTYKIVLSYHGGSFDGWQKQPSLNTIQGLVEKSIGIFVDEQKAKLLKSKDLPLEGCALVAGRTDKGVTALQQVCSFYTWKKDVCIEDIEDVINSAAPGRLRVISVAKMSRVFHPNFSAKWRRYLYIFPLNGENGKQNGETEEQAENVNINEDHRKDITECAEFYREENIDNLMIDDKDVYESEVKPRSFSICKVNQLICHLEGKSLSYKMFARDTKASRNIGPPTECFVYHARATEARLPRPLEDNGEGTKVMCVELVANRFLRKMVRVLVATSIREAAAGAEDDALLKLMDATCRRATAPPAPPDGLCLVNVGYTEFDPKMCLIP